MLEFSTLYETRTAPTITDGAGGTLPDPTQWLAGMLTDGTLVYHGQPGTGIPDGAARAIRDGSAAWTWTDIAAEQGATWCACVTPHTWNDEDTNKNLAVADWPLLASPTLD